jgi:hypothetical protein
LRASSKTSSNVTMAMSSKWISELIIGQDWFGFRLAWNTNM